MGKSRKPGSRLSNQKSVFHNFSLRNPEKWQNFRQEYVPIMKLRIQCGSPIETKAETRR